MAKPSIRGIRNRAFDVSGKLDALDGMLDDFMVAVLEGKLEMQGVALEIERIRKYLEETQTTHRWGLIAHLNRLIEGER